MRLRLALEGFTVGGDSDRTFYLPPGGGLVVVVSTLVQTPLDEELSVERILGGELGTGTLVKGGTILEWTQTGWPLELTPAMVRDGERVIEQRLLAVYKFAEWRAHVLVRGQRPDVWTAHQATLRTALTTARPDWRADGEVYCLAHLLE